MPTEITMPKLSDTMEEGTILKWRVAEGDPVRRGEIIAEVETDKAAMEMESFVDGVVAELRVAEGETVPVGTVLALLEGKGEKKESSPGAPETTGKGKEKTPSAVKEKVAEKGEKKKAGPKPAEMEEEAAEEESAADEEIRTSRTSQPREAPLTVEEEPGPSLRAAVSPAARRLAEERGVDLARVRGSGPGGRIVLADVEGKAAPAPPALAPREGDAAGKGGKKSVKIRRLVARKMVESWQSIPHFFVTIAVDMSDAIRFRKDLGVTVNDFVVAAAARSLREHPWVNSLWQDGEAVEQEPINIALAVATERGLYNPVLRDCGGLALKEVSRRGRELAERAHGGRLKPEDLEGGTFTISNMGMLGVESFSAIITPPQAAVLAVGTVKGEVVVDEQGEPGIATMLRLTLSADHRILDGADAAEFLATLKSYLEAPITLVTPRD